jgi:hypothetical protein
MKTCNKCNIEKPETDFGKRSASIDGLQNYCKICSSKVAIKNRYIRRNTKSGHIAAIVSNRKVVAKKENIPFSVSLEYLINQATDVCPVLGIELSWGIRKGKLSDNSPSLDKIKPELGYVEGNVRWMSYLANSMKRNATPEQLKTFANWILANA